MTNLKLQHVRFRLFANISARVEEENLRTKATINYIGNNVYGDIDIKFYSTTSAAYEYRFLQIINEEFAKVYQSEMESNN